MSMLSVWPIRRPVDPFAVDSQSNRKTAFPLKYVLIVYDIHGIAPYVNLFPGNLYNDRKTAFPLTLILISYSNAKNACQHVT